MHFFNVLQTQLEIYNTIHTSYKPCASCVWQVMDRVLLPKHEARGHENKEGRNEDPELTVRTEQTRLKRLLYGFVD